ncbi:helix-turn-helix transcriptional regulator [Rhodobacteraceae bacterium NNCM2]|nr:helix-turn-helix transcriptional regulator [Coraliihabitans acroporae]
MSTTEQDFPPFLCGLDAALRVMSGKWKPLILFFLFHAPRRYGELKRCMEGVSDKMLIQHLKELDSDGIVLRTDHKEIPPRVDYDLTPFGRSLAAALQPLCEWGTANEVEVAAALRRR